MPHYTDDELIEYLTEFIESGNKPTISNLNEADGPSGQTYSNRFGSLSSALDECGFKNLANNARGREFDKYEDDDELLDALLSAANDDTITRRDVEQSEELPSTMTYRYRFGSLEKAANEVGLTYERSKSIRPEDEVLDMLSSWASSNDTINTTTIRTNNSLPTMHEVRKYIGSIDDVRNEYSLHQPQKGTMKDIFTEHYVYVLETDKGFYVGESSDIIKRLRAHNRSDKSIQSVERVVSVDAESAKEREREMSVEIAREYETANVYGGQ